MSTDQALGFEPRLSLSKSGLLPLQITPEYGTTSCRPFLFYDGAASSWNSTHGIKFEKFPPGNVAGSAAAAPVLEAVHPLFELPVNPMSKTAWVKMEELIPIAPFDASASQ